MNEHPMNEFGPDDVWLDQMISAYIIAALWSETDDDSEPLDKSYDFGDLAAETVQSATADCTDFANAQWHDLEDMAPAQAGHDFLLTRNRHGAGYWDRGLGAQGERLTEACRPYGEQSFYVGDDGLIYVYP
jgi:hypothetical protein